jgi:hypothetical protein
MEQLAEARSSCVRRGGLGWLRGGQNWRFPLSPYCGRAGVVLMSMLTPTSGRSGTWACVHVDAVDAGKGQSSPSLHWAGLGGDWPWGWMEPPCCACARICQPWNTSSYKLLGGIAIVDLW